MWFLFTPERDEDVDEDGEGEGEGEGEDHCASCPRFTAHQDHIKVLLRRYSW